MRRNEHYNVTFLGARPRCEFRINTYYVRILSLWNSLPFEIKELDTTENENNNYFKKLVKNYYHEKVDSMFNPDNACTWVAKCHCSTCRD